MRTPKNSFSVSAKAYKRFEAWCKANDISVSSLVEYAVAKELGTTPPPTTRFPKTKRRREAP